MHRIERFLPLLIVAALSLGGCNVGLDEAECTSDADCNAPNVCLAGTCGPPSGGGDTGDDVAIDGGDTGDAGDAGDTGEGGPTCATYCREITDTCTGPNAQYASEESCIELCIGYGWPAGSLERDRENTIGCRTKHTQYAALSANNGETDQVTSHCRHAGFTGGNACGTWCDVYCDAAMHICQTEPLYDDLEQCRGVCESMSVGGVPGDTVGNSVQCRIYHLGAATGDGIAETVHCPHATLQSTPDTCGDPAGECGDGTVDEGEECDDGEDNADEPDACRTDCTAPACGDGIIDSDEICEPEFHDIWCEDSCAAANPTICTFCERDDACGDGFRCAGIDEDGELSLCLPACESDENCPEGFACDEIEFGLVCMPDNRQACEDLGAIEICDNEIDDNGNDLVDCDDPLCAIDDACAEPEVCDNREDDDGDGDVDCEDVDCADFGDCLEAGCTPDRSIGSRVNRVVATFNRRDIRGDDASGTCGPSGAEDIVLEWTAPESGAFFVHVDSPVQAVVHVHQLTCDGPERACQRDARTTDVRFIARGGEVLAIVIEPALASAPDGATFTVDLLRVEGSNETCSNREDDDDDGFTDCSDSDCASLPVCDGAGVECRVDGDCDDTEFCAEDGTCICLDGRRRCGDVCVDMSEDFYNCGSCFNICDPGEACEGSRCVNAAEACRCDLITERYCPPGIGACTDPEGCCATSLTGCRSIQSNCSED